MSTLLETPANTNTDPQLDAKAVRTLARSIHREMREAGYSSAQVVDFASTIVDLVRDQFREEADVEEAVNLVAE